MTDFALFIQRLLGRAGAGGDASPWVAAAAFAAIVAWPGPVVAGIPRIPPPEGARLVDFDDLDPAPGACVTKICAESSDCCGTVPILRVGVGIPAAANCPPPAS